MSDSFTQTEHEGWFSRIMSSLKGMIVGLALFAVSFVVLFWNEGNSVKTARSLDEGEGQAVHVEAETVDPANENALVHFNAQAITDEVLVDKQFNLQEPALRLHRNVQMYQWEEKIEKKTKKNVGGGTTTTKTPKYSKIWSSRLIDSNKFQDTAGKTNPESFPVQSKHSKAKRVMVGAFELPSNLANEINNSEAIALTQENIPERFEGQMVVSGNDLYLGQDPSSPQIGDTRVQVSVTLPCEVSVCAQQTGETLRPFATSNGRELSMLRTGTLSMHEMFEAARADNTRLTWILRFVGSLVMFIGLTLLMRPLVILGDVIPFIGSIVSGGTMIVSGLLTMVFAPGTIGFAWVFYRPLVGIPLLALAGGSLAWLIARRSKPTPIQANTSTGAMMLGEDDIVR